MYNQNYFFFTKQALDFILFEFPRETTCVIPKMNMTGKWIWHGKQKKTFDIEWEWLPSIFLTVAKLFVTPVAVSLCTMQTALMVWAVSSAIFEAKMSRSAPLPHSLSTTSTLKLRRCCWSIQSKLNCPIRKETVRSPGDNVFVSALSQAPVPVPIPTKQHLLWVIIRWYTERVEQLCSYFTNSSWWT